MRQTIIFSTLLLVVGLLVGGWVTSRAVAQPIPLTCCNDMFLDPDRYVRINDSTPYAVPTNRVLLIGGITGDTELQITINGQVVADFWRGANVISPGLVARGGDTVAVLPNGGASAQAYGKLYHPK